MRRLKLSIFLVILSHLVLMDLYPLMDTTEARYADIARRMLELNDWITPWFDDGQPFWGKPPLSFWLTMAGFKIFGVNEFGARFFYLVVSLLVLVVTYACARRHSQYIALVSVAVLTSFFIFYIASVAVMTDMVLLLGGVIALYSQLNVLHGQENSRINSILFAIGLSIGLLAKGPIAIILFVTPVLVWMAGIKNFRFFFEQFNLLLIISITAIITLPWYVIAELKTPGFLNYFIVGEHWQRFIVSGWKGDLYGSAHNFPRGYIWLFMLTATVPWCLMLPYIIFRHREKVFANNTTLPLGTIYLLGGWVLTPLVFFTFAGNILWTYVLPGLPALAIFLSQILSNALQQRTLTQLAQISLATVVMIKVCYLLSLTLDNSYQFKTTKYLITDLQDRQISLEDVFFYREVPFSAKFYSGGRIKPIQKISIEEKLASRRIFLIIEKNEVPDTSMLNVTTRPISTYGDFVILEVTNPIKK
jgi:4-amino-4-deoxy-L-arabinose transferase-like glycosyltransferase